jgi:ribosomal protein L11 methyltransferase
LDWLEIAVPTAPGDVEAVADVLRRYAPTGVAIEEPLLSHGDSVSVDTDRPALVKAYLRQGDHLPSQRRALRRDLSHLTLSVPLPPLRGRWVREEDWAESWKQHFHVERIGKRLVVRPRWREYHPQPGDVVINIDPGMAFGTGQHATTHMCLLALEKYVFAGCHLLDLGTGSGILAIAAAELGAGHVLALDIDALATSVAHHNVEANTVSDRVRVTLGSLAEYWPLATPYQAAFDIVVANINASTIIEMARPLVETLKKGGVGIAGGIIEERFDSCRDALEEAGATIIDVMTGGEWRTIIFEA